ncbi:MAG: class I SAM-dependent methyltransferase [Caldilineaceae bacterium]
MTEEQQPHEPGLDAIAAFNRDRWEALVAADVPYARPLLDLDTAGAAATVDPYGLLGDVAGKEVLCLAAGGGQQSAAFGVLGAHVTVVDITAGQLAKDRQVAEHYGFDVTLIQADMRDLSMFVDALRHRLARLLHHLHPRPAPVLPKWHASCARAASIACSGAIPSSWAATNATGTDAVIGCATLRGRRRSRL